MSEMIWENNPALDNGNVTYDLMLDDYPAWMDDGPDCE